MKMKMQMQMKVKMKVKMGLVESARQGIVWAVQDGNEVSMSKGCEQHQT